MLFEFFRKTGRLLYGQHSAWAEYSNHAKAQSCSYNLALKGNEFGEDILKNHYMGEALDIIKPCFRDLIHSASNGKTSGGQRVLQ